MLNSKRFASPILGIALAAGCMACGVAVSAPQEAAKAGQDAAVGTRDAASGLPTGKRQHKPVVGTKDMEKQASRHGMADMDTDKDGRLSRSEFAAAHDGKDDEFAAHDGNGDGFITQAEMDAHHAAMKAGHEAAHTVQQAESKAQDHH